MDELKTIVAKYKGKSINLGIERNIKHLNLTEHDFGLVESEPKITNCDEVKKPVPFLTFSHCGEYDSNKNEIFTSE